MDLKMYVEVELWVGVRFSPSEVDLTALEVEIFPSREKAEEAEFDEVHGPFDFTYSLGVKE